MTVLFRSLLVICAFFACYVIVKNVRKSRLIISDCIYWVLFSFAMIVLAIFPGIANYLAELLGIVSPINLVYLVIIGLLLLKTFKQSIRISELEIKIKNIIQAVTLDKDTKK
jgi:hypothetical protein